MKKFFFFLLTIVLHNSVTAQNVGIGTAEPYNKLQVNGSLLVTVPTTSTNTAPTAAQIKTIINGSTVSFVAGDSTGRIYDPGGPAGNYLANLTGFTLINAGSVGSGIEITVESMNLAGGDSLIIKETSASTTNLLAVGNGYSTLGKWVFNSSRLYLIFKSNADANVGTGFSLLFKRLYTDGAALQNVTGYVGNGLFFDAKNGAIRAGSINTTAIGSYSSAMGLNNAASGSNSVAMGENNEATGSESVALGFNNEATGDLSTALGTNTKASGHSSTAMGGFTLAIGDNSTAMGRSSRASGNSSVAMGSVSNASSDYATATGRYTDATGYAATATGDSTLADGPISFASGFRTSASGNGSTSMGRYTRASGFAATATGDSTLASGLMSFANGFRTTASGRQATAMGEGTDASGDRSTALGFATIASGNVATAIGLNTTASGSYSTAMGSNTIASGRNSTAMGETTVASGNESTAMGYFTTSSGDRSTAIGSYVSTNDNTGALIIGDYSTSTILNSTIPNSFRARFDGGYRFYTSAAAITSESCLLAGGSNAWSTTSDVRTKENFEAVNGEDFLRKISLMNLTSWNYKKQNPQTFRHYGPMAQDFYAAFGKDKYGNIGNDTTINSSDFDGVNLIAIQALEKRTQKIHQLETDNTKLQKEVDDLKMRLQKLEAIIQKNQL
jgi:Chaperone of endosialidase/Head domain of trimeric autotransporter adhesin